MKPRITLLLWTLILCACSTGKTTPQTFPTETATETIPPKSSTKTIIEIRTPHIDEGPDGNFRDTPTEIPYTSTECGYQWAYEELPDLTLQFDRAVKSFIVSSVSRATAFGENCVSSDGQVISFLAMETDFYVVASVETLDDYETFGNWIALTMQTINAISPDLLVGSNPGFVEFRFERNMNESIAFRVPIQQYNESANGKTGEELFRMFYSE